MNILDYITQAEQRRRREEEELLGRPLPVSPLPAGQPGQPILPSKAPEPSLDELMARSYSPDTVAAPPAVPQSSVAGSERPPVPQTSRTADPFRSALDIPQSVQNKARMQGFLAQLTNASGGLGRSGRNYRADPYAAQKARSAVISDYVNRQQADVANRQRQQQLDLARRRQELAERPAPVDPIERALKMATLRKSMAEGSLKEREVSQAGKEDEYKAELVRIINESGKVGTNAATMAMSLRTLESMAKDVGLSELDLKKAKAMGGGNISGKNIAYNSTAQPRLASLVAKAAEGKSKFLGNINDSDAYKEVVNSPDLNAKQKREIIEQQGWDKEIERTQDRLYRYADETLKKISAPENGVASMLKAITDLKEALAKHPDVPGWGEISSAANAFGPLGQWGVDLSQINDPAAKDIMQAVRGYNEAYRRLYSGAAINKDEKADFASQLGAGAFSNPESLKIGVERAERILRNGIWNTFSTIDQRVWNEYIPRAKTFLPREKTVTPEKVQLLADKYRVQ